MRWGAGIPTPWPKCSNGTWFARTLAKPQLKAPHKGKVYCGNAFPRFNRLPRKRESRILFFFFTSHKRAMLAPQQQFLPMRRRRPDTSEAWTETKNRYLRSSDPREAKSMPAWMNEPRSLAHGPSSSRPQRWKVRLRNNMSHAEGRYATAPDSKADHVMGTLLQTE